MPDEGRRPVLTAGLIAAIVVLGIVAAFNGLAAFAILGVPIAALLAARPKLAALSVLAGFFLNGIRADVGGLTVRPEEVGVVVGLVALGLAWMLRDRRPVRTPLAPFVVLFLLLNLVASVLNSPDARTSIIKCGAVALAIGSYFVVTNAIRDLEALSEFVRYAVVLAMVEAALAVPALLLRLLHTPITGLVVDDPETGYWAVAGTMLEPNVYGNTIATLGILYLGRYIVSGWRFGVAGLLGFVVLLTGLLYSNTRGAWIGFAIGLLVLLRERRAVSQPAPGGQPALSVNAVVTVLPMVAVIAFLLYRPASGAIGGLA